MESLIRIKKRIKKEKRQSNEKIHRKEEILEELENKRLKESDVITKHLKLMEMKRKQLHTSVQLRIAEKVNKFRETCRINTQRKNSIDTQIVTYFLYTNQ